MMFRQLGCCAVLLASLAACDGKVDVSAEVAQFCRPSSTSLADPLDLASPRDAAVAARFGDVCELSRPKGLRFDTEAPAYECRLSLPRVDSVFFEKRGERFVRETRETLRSEGDFDEESFEKRVAALQAGLKQPDERLTAAFGVPLSLSDFHAAAMLPDDLIEAEYARGRGEVGLGLPLAIFAIEPLVDISIILLTEDGSDVDYIWSREDLEEHLRGVESLEGAANLLYLKEELGFVPNAAPDARAQPLCDSTSAIADTEGWRFEGVNFVKNCSPGYIRNIRATRSGEISTVTTAKTKMSDCYD